MLSIMCEFSDIKVVTTKTVAEAWRLAILENFDLYLLDSRFPGGGGLELCRCLREYAPDTPIFIYSDDECDADKKNGFAGASNYPTKPYLAELAVNIRQNIEQIKKSVRQTKIIDASTPSRAARRAAA